MDYRILGSLEVLAEGQPVDVGSKRQRALLSLLLLHPNRVVSSDHILDALWGDDALGKENAMWVAVSRLRSALEPDGESGDSVLATRDHGYQLQVPDGSLDAAVFEGLIEQARAQLGPNPDAALSLVEEALALWRGEPLGEFRHEEFAQIEAARFEDLRLEALELQADANLRLGRSREQIAKLDALSAQHPLRERFVELLMRSLYQSGRQAEALRVYDRHRRALGEEMGLEPSPELARLEEQILLHDPAVRRLRDTRDAPSDDVTNPFKGLRAFGEEDADDFFGRDRVVSDIVRRLGTQSMVALVGASGSGKSSIVRAGVIPALRKGAIEGSDGWVIAQMVPGAHPMAELEAALLRSSLDAPDSVADQLADPDMGLVRAALRLVDNGGRLLLVVDQFEELFTLVEDEAERVRFLDLLEPALDDPHGRIALLLTLRADFYDRPLTYPAFADRLGEAIVNVTTLTADELEAAAREPLRRSGVSVEPALLATLLTEVVGQPGALPLFQYTLTTLFDRRDGDVVTLELYRDMGGLRGALTQRAEDLFAGLHEREQRAARQLFLRLVAISGDREWSRRRVPASELVSLRTDLVAMQRAIEEFGSHRLLAFDRDQVTGSPTVEVAHEALLTEWPRLRGWIDEARDDVVRHAALVAAMNEWQAADRNADYLLVGQRLADYEAWSGTTLLELSDQEQDYLQRAIAVRDDADRDEADRAAREAALGRRAKRRAWSLVAVIVAVVGVVGWVLLTADDPGPEIALVDTPLAQTNPFGIHEQFRNGWEQAIRDSAFEPVELTLRSDLSEVSELVASGVQLLVLDIDASQETVQLARANPDARFVTFAEHIADNAEPNVTNVVVQSGEGSFLAGVAAALTSETGTIGFVGGSTQIIDHFRAGYEAGARFVRPDIRVISSYLPTDQGLATIWFSPEVGASRARRLYEEGADVVFHAAGTSGDQIPALADALSATLGRHLWVIGVDSDQYLAVGASEREHVLTSMLKRTDLALGVAIERYLDDDLPLGTVEFGLRDGAVSYSTLGGHLTEPTIAELELVRAGIVDGSIVVPQVPTAAPTHDPDWDVQVTVQFDGTSCLVDAPRSVPVGSSILFEFMNSSPAAATLVVEPRYPGFDSPIDDRVQQEAVRAVPGSRNSVVSRTEDTLTWMLGCVDAAFNQVGAASSFEVSPVPDEDLAGQFVFDGEACRLQEPLDVVDDTAVFRMSDVPGEGLIVQWVPVAGVAPTMEDVRALGEELVVRPAAWTMLDPDVGRAEVQYSPPLVAGLSYIVNCFTGAWPDDTMSYPAAVITVVG